jgi:hypothetical protein
MPELEKGLACALRGPCGVVDVRLIDPQETPPVAAPSWVKLYLEIFD